MSIFNTLFGKKGISDKVKVLSKADYAQAIKGGNVQLVDVRTAREFRSGHIKGAKNIDFFSLGSFNASFEKMDKNKAVYLYCQSGNRSQKAAKRLVKMGFETVIDLSGGYGAWSH